MLISDPYSLDFQIELSNLDSFYLYIRIIEGPDNSQNAGFPEICKGSKMISSVGPFDGKKNFEKESVTFLLFL